MSEPTFTQRHYETISKLKLVLIVVCLIAVPISFAINRGEVGSVGSRVTRIETPCQRYGDHSEQCTAYFEHALLSINHAEACALERKAGTLKAIRAFALSLRERGVDVSFTEPCAGARLKQERRRHEERAETQRAEGGGALQQPSSTAHQPPSPHHGGSGNGEHLPAPSAPEETPHNAPNPAPSPHDEPVAAPSPPSQEPAPEQAAPAAHSLHETLEGVGTTVHETVCSLPVALCP